MRELVFDFFAALWFFGRRRRRGRLRFGRHWLRRRWRWWRRRLRLRLSLALHTFRHDDSDEQGESYGHEQKGVHQLHDRGDILTFVFATILPDVPFSLLAR